MIINKDTKLFVEKGGLPGVKRVAGKLAEDLRDVFGSTVAPIEADAAELLKGNGSEARIIAVTLGNSGLLSQLISEGKFRTIGERKFLPIGGGIYENMRSNVSKNLEEYTWSDDDFD